MSIISGFPISCSDQIDVIRLYTDFKQASESANSEAPSQQAFWLANPPERVSGFGADYRPPEIGQ